MGPQFLNPFNYAYFGLLILSIVVCTRTKHPLLHSLLILLSGLLCWFTWFGAIWYEDSQWDSWFEGLSMPSQAEIVAYDSDPTAEKSFALLFGLPFSALLIFLGWAGLSFALWLVRRLHVKSNPSFKRDA